MSTAQSSTLARMPRRSLPPPPRVPGLSGTLAVGALPAPPATAAGPFCRGGILITATAMGVIDLRFLSAPLDDIDGLCESWETDARWPTGVRVRPGGGVIDAAAGELGSYLRGELTAFETPVDPALPGTPFQLRVWQALRAIPWGATVTYGQLARRIGRPGAARAVGSANGRNPVPVIIPCHRVVAAAGALGGFSAGLDVKRFLLRLEGHRDSSRISS